MHAEAPGEEVRPAGHVLQLIEAGDDAYVPVIQGEHATEPAQAEY